MKLPSHIKQHNLVPDPAGRAGHWYDPVTDSVVKMPPDWRPTANGSAPTGDGLPDAADDLSGARVEIVQGRFEGRRGQISETGLNDDEKGIRVIVDGDGLEINLDAFDGWVRLLTPEEVADDEAALYAALHPDSEPPAKVTSDGKKVKKTTVQSPAAAGKIDTEKVVASDEAAGGSTVPNAPGPESGSAVTPTTADASTVSSAPFVGVDNQQAAG